MTPHCVAPRLVGMSDDGERVPVPLRRGKKELSAPKAQREPSSDILVPDILSNPLLNAEDHLKLVLQMLERTREELVEATDAVESHGVMDYPPGTEASAILTDLESKRADVRRAFERYRNLQGIARKTEQELRKHVLEAPLAGKWGDEHRRLRGELVQQYAGLGAQYDMLCDNAAATAVRLRQMEESGRDFESGEYIDMHKLHLGYINQLQKYTEAMKSESINKQTQEVATEIIRIAEQYFGNAYPETWSKFVKDIRGAVGEGSAA